MARNSHKRLNPWVTVLLIILIIAIVAIAIFGYSKGWFDGIFNKPDNPNGNNQPSIVSGDLSIHFMELGNSSDGDSIYIKAGDVDILVDAGSKESSVATINKYVNNYCTDGILEYVIVTHADLDHIAGFTDDGGESIFDLYECKTIIDFPLTNKASQAKCKQYLANRDEEVKQGAKHYTALQCYNNTDGASRTYALSEGIELEILYHEFYEQKTSKENNYSVCFLINQGSRHFLFTGDLEKNGEASLVEHNDLPEVDVFKAGHHGSATSSTDTLLSVIKPDIVAITCVAGGARYNFPRQESIDRIAKYTDKVYVTTVVDDSADSGYALYNGNIVIVSSADKEIEVNCSNNNTKLKDSSWFINNRVMPTSWATA